MIISYIILSICLFCLTFACLYPFSNKNFYRDEGNWFYYAIFQKDGLENYSVFDNKLYSIPGYFNLQLIFAFFYKYLGKNNLLFLNKIRIGLYSLQVVLIFITFNIINHNVLCSIITSLLSILLFFIPKLKFSLTYAENFQILPILAAFICWKLALNYNQELGILLSGILISFSFQFKITGFLFVLLFPLLLIDADISYSYLWYLLGVFILNIILPFVFMLSLKRGRIYCLCLLRDFLFYALHILSKIKIKFKNSNKFIDYLNNHINNIANIKDPLEIDKKQRLLKIENNSYVKDRKKISKISSLEVIRSFYKDIEILFPIAFCQIIIGFYELNINTMAITLFLVIGILIWGLQGAMSKAHLNISLIPLYILFCQGLFYIWQLSFFTKILTIFWIIIYLIKYFPAFYYEIKKPNKNHAFYGEKYNFYFQEALLIGKFIKNHTVSTSKIYVWGNMPTVYLYSDRMSVDYKFLHTYQVMNKITKNIMELLDSLRINPPHYLVLFQYMDFEDKWNYETIQNYTGIPFKPVAYKNSKNKKYRNIPIYELNVEMYKEILLENYLIVNNNYYLKKVLVLEPNNIEAKFWIKIENTNFEEAIKILENLDISKTFYNLLAALLSRFYKNNLSKKMYKELNNNQTWRSYLLQGEYLSEQNKFKKALEYYYKALYLCSLSPELLNNIGIILAYTNQKEQAIKLLKKAIKILPNYDDAKNNLNLIQNYNK